MVAVARVLVDTGLIHLDRPFDYLIPESMDALAQPGVRVKVRFAGRLREGWIIERADSSEHQLTPLAAVVSAEPVLSAAVAQLAHQVAERFAGMTTDVVRMAIPPRQARVEKEPATQEIAWAHQPSVLPSGYDGLTAFMSQLDEHPRASWALLPTKRAAAEIAPVICQAANAGRVLVVVPDQHDVGALSQELAAIAPHVVVLTADLPPAQRYRNFLRVLRGSGQVVIGTRSAIFAPVHDLRLILVVDDGDESHVEPHAPGWNTRAVASLRAFQESAALLIVGHSVSVDTQALVEQHWLGVIDPDPTTLKELAPRVSAESDVQTGARIPTAAWRVIKSGLAAGPVLVGVAFTGYAPSLACADCRTPARCQCGGRMSATSKGHGACRLCARSATDWRCGECGGTALRSTSIGAERTVEELGKAFPGTPVVASSSDSPLASVDDSPRIVVSTTGLEPATLSGYRAIVLLDAEAQLGRSDLRVEEESRRRWFNALSLASDKAPSVIVGAAGHATIQSLIAWAPRRAASRELAERSALHLGPVWQIVTIEAGEIDPWLQELSSLHIEVLGPLPSTHGERIVARHPRDQVTVLSREVKAIAARRSAQKLPPARIRVDPYSVG